jgi:glycerophosphoryl diester phosphodiesterase
MPDLAGAQHDQNGLCRIMACRSATGNCRARPDAPFTNSRDELKALFDAGVDGIWADFPATAVEVRGGE